MIYDAPIIEIDFDLVQNQTPTDDVLPAKVTFLDGNVVTYYDAIQVSEVMTQMMDQTLRQGKYENLPWIAVDIKYPKWKEFDSIEIPDSMIELPPRLV